MDFVKKIMIFLFTNHAGRGIISVPLSEGSFLCVPGAVMPGDAGPLRGRYKIGRILSGSRDSPRRTAFRLNFQGGAEMRVKITLACSECKQRNYDTKKNKKNDPDRLELKKYCRFCRKHTLHRETK